MSLFERPENYSKMLDKLAFVVFVLAFFVSGALVGVLSARGITLPSPPWLAKLELGVLGFKGTFWAIAPATILAWIFRRVKMHDRISDLFGLREAFDVHIILVRLAGEVEIAVTLELIRKIRAKRRELMTQVFYKYVDSTNPKISKHEVSSALDAWFDYWIFIEGATVLIPFAIAFCALSSFGIAASISFLSLFFVLMALTLYRRCVPRAEAEIAAITQHPEWEQWKKEIRRSFNHAL